MLLVSAPIARAGSSEASAPARIEIVDVDRTLTPDGPRDDAPVCHLEATGEREGAAFERLWSLEASVFQFENWTNVGPDAPFRQIRIVRGDREITLISWHPTMERDAKLVATSRGVTALADRTRAEVLAEDDRDYVARREAFDRIVDGCIDATRPRDPPRR